MEMKDIIPQVLIFSTQRSGTHLLASFFEQHPQIHVRGEAFLRYERTGTITENIPGKLNMGILMYNQVLTMESLGGDSLATEDHPFIERPEGRCPKSIAGTSGQKGS